jgi:hypothetical protein
MKYLAKIFYLLKPLIPRIIQIRIRRVLVNRQRKKYSTIWPIDPKSAEKPKNWRGWPQNKQFAFVLTHDVETHIGHDRCSALMKIEKDLGFRSSYNFVPKRYDVSMTLLNELKNNGFEVGVHGVYHDGKLYESKTEFLRRAQIINNYLTEWDAVGFRSPAMHHNLDWIHDLNIEYDLSTFDTDPFEPQPDGMQTIFPFWVEKKNANSGYVELPYTLVQDFTLFVLMGEKNADLWKEKLDWIVEQGGMALVNVHPDYINFGQDKLKVDEFPVDYYSEFLQYVKSKFKNKYWQPLPQNLARYYRNFVVPAKNDPPKVSAV